MVKVCIGGGGGFIGHHLARKLKNEGHYVVVADIRRGNLAESDCNEFHNADLRLMENCMKVTEGCEWVFNLAADMGGMGYIQTNQSRILYNNTMISFNMLEASRNQGCKRFFYSSTACVYPEEIQEDPNCQALREDMAWPCNPQELYGLEKIVSEELALAYGRDFDIETRVARFHNIYGPEGTWEGGREKAPAAFCRKIIAAEKEVEMWDDGLQTRSFCFIDDCLEGIMKIMLSDYQKPLNLGSDFMISMNDFMKLVMKFDEKDLKIKHIVGPQGVRGRNSDNTLIKQVLKWAPSISLEIGMKKTYDYIKSEMSKKNGDYNTSVIMKIEKDFDNFVGLHDDK